MAATGGELSMKRRSLLTIAAVLTLPIWLASAKAQQTSAQQAKQAAEMVDTAKFKKAPPYTIGVSAGYMANSWVVFSLQHIKYEASLHKEIKDVIVTDAAFKPAKQVADIEDLINKHVSAIIYWPIDDKSIEAVLQKAEAAGIPTVNAGGGFTDAPGTTTNAYISQWDIGEKAARQLFKDMNGKGKIFAMLPIAGHYASVDQLAALKAVMKDYPGIELLSAEYGDWNRAKAKQITENLLQRYPVINGVFSPSGQMSAGIVEAFDEAGRLKDVIFSPADEYNGWLKDVAKLSKGGVVTFPTKVGRDAVELALSALEGKPVPKGRLIVSQYIPAAEAAKLAQADKSDDSWSNALPKDWQPK
jgi:ribose transport system substrate-binding protein